MTIRYTTFKIITIAEHKREVVSMITINAGTVYLLFIGLLLYIGLLIWAGRSKGYAVDSMADLRLEFEKKNLQK